MVAIVLHQISLTTSSGDQNATAFDCALIKRSKSVDSSVLPQRKKKRKNYEVSKGSEFNQKI